MGFLNIQPGVPDWQCDGVLPAVVPQGNDAVRSPYKVTVVALVERFGQTDYRRSLLRSFFAFRRELRDCGWCSGFQWFNESFLEDVDGWMKGDSLGIPTRCRLFIKARFLTRLELDVWLLKKDIWI